MDQCEGLFFDSDRLFNWKHSSLILLAQGFPSFATYWAYFFFFGWKNEVMKSLLVSFQQLTGTEKKNPATLKGWTINWITNFALNFNLKSSFSGRPRNIASLKGTGGNNSCVHWCQRCNVVFIHAPHSLCAAACEMNFPRRVPRKQEAAMQGAEQR